MDDQMQEVSISNVLELNNLIVPEIQREYVWGFNQYGILETFIEDLKEAYGVETKLDEATKNKITALEQLIKESDAAVKPALIEALNNLKSSVLGHELNIGFLYSYKPNYEISEEGKDLYLIDGQQRFTTLVLFLFYFSIKESRKEDFIKVLRFNEKLDKSGFDYRVRNITHDFLIDLFTKVNSGNDFLEIRNKSWFLSNYSQDTTVRAIVGDNESNGVFNLLNDSFREDNNKYFNFILNKVKFWHFKTEKTDQGEELYITMNSRGQQLADYENIRAKLFENTSDQLAWSKKWEEWQDYFWKHRKSGAESADDGFNEFLRWVVIIKMIAKGEPLESGEKSSRKDEPLRLIIRNLSEKLPIEYLSLENIKKYFNGLKTLYEVYTRSIESLISCYTFFNDSKENAFDLLKNDWIDGGKKGLVQIDLFKLLPVINYISKIDKKKINGISLFRLIRFFENRSTDENIGKAVDQNIINGIKLIDSFLPNIDIINFLDLEKASTALLNEPEKRKLKLLRESKEREKLEEQFWLAEDYEENEGNIDHLVRLCLHLCESQKADFTVNLFKKVFQCYSEIWESESAWCDLIPSEMYKIYNDNRIYVVSSWHRHDTLMELIHDRFLDSDIELSDFLEERRKEFVSKYKSAEEMLNEKSMKNQLYIYAIITEELMGQEWSWNNKWNFGAYEEVEDRISLFHSGEIYERYDKVWRTGYIHGLWIQDNVDAKRDYFDELLEWSKT